MKIWVALSMALALLAVSAQAQDRPGTSVFSRSVQIQTAPTGGSYASGASAERPKIDPAKEADIRRLLDLMGTKAIAQQVMDAMAKNLKPMMVSSLPPGDYRDKLVELFLQKFQAKADTQQLIEMAIPSYDKYFSDDEIKGLIAFYQTPLGRKALEVLPKLGVELQTQGAKWGQDLGRQCMLEVLSENPDLAQALAAASKGARPQ
jgi:uncharacterized protein